VTARQTHFSGHRAKVADGSPCCDWVGENGAGHFLKRVHNGIGCGDMQLIGSASAAASPAALITPERKR
jgi:6-phosphogluconate dehydrogenase